MKLRATAAIICFALTSHAYVLQNGTNYVTDGSRNDFTNAYEHAVTGDLITITNGTFTWTAGATIAKAIRVSGGGSGRIVARSTTGVTIGTGTKTFTIAREWPMTNQTIIPGQTLRAWVTGGFKNTTNGFGSGVTPYMEGTVSSLAGSTLQMNITSTNGLPQGHSGTFYQWIFDSGATTTITNNSSTPLFTINGSVNGVSRLTGIRFIRRTGSADHVAMSASGSVIVPVVSGCWIDCRGSTHGISSTANRGLLSQCTFNSLVNGGSDTEGFVLKNAGLSASWTTVSTMGMNDVNGNANFYIEDCDFHGFWTGIDADDGARIVQRYTLYNECSNGGSHGADTSELGVRHLEVYKCIYKYSSQDDQSANLNWWLLLRGGTGTIASNQFDNICCAWSDKNEIVLQIQNVDRNAGPNGCWGAGIVGVQYHCPRQIGFGRVTGSGTDGLGRSVDSYGYYVGDSEPLYIWGNTGTQVIAVDDSGYGECASADSPSGYIQSGRDYILSAKPSYTFYTYPHPLATGSGDQSAPPDVHVPGPRIFINQMRVGNATFQ